MFKKIIVIGAAVAAMAAVMAPAALANLEFNEAEESYEGRLAFEAPAPFVGTFGCEVTVTVSSEGGETATVNTFEPTTGTCSGNGLFAGCKLKAHVSSAPFTAHTDATDLTITDLPGEVTVQNQYESCENELPGSHLAFEVVTGQQTNSTGGHLGRIHQIHISGKATSGAIASGSVTAEGGEELEVN
jgi:hypothetical protein